MVLEVPKAQAQKALKKVEGKVKGSLKQRIQGSADVGLVSKIVRETFIQPNLTFRYLSLNIEDLVSGDINFPEI